MGRKLGTTCGYLLVNKFFEERRNYLTDNNCLCCCRIASSLKPRITPLSVLFTKAMYIWEGVADAVNDGSSPSMAPSAVVLCLLTQCCGSEVVGKTTTDLGLLRASATTFIRGKSVLGSTLETVPGMGTLMVIQAGIPCPG